MLNFQFVHQANSIYNGELQPNLYYAAQFKYQDGFLIRQINLNKIRRSNMQCQYLQRTTQSSRTRLSFSRQNTATCSTEGALNYCSAVKVQ
jgi:hypothetical protein